MDWVSNTRTILTFLACVNAMGNEVPPLIIAKGKSSACLSLFQRVNHKVSLEPSIPSKIKGTWKIYLVSSGLKEIFFSTVAMHDCK